MYAFDLYDPKSLVTMKTISLNWTGTEIEGLNALDQETVQSWNQYGIESINGGIVYPKDGELFLESLLQFSSPYFRYYKRTI